MVKVSPAEYFVSPLLNLPQTGKTKRGGQTCCDTIAVLDHGCYVYHLSRQTGQLTVSVNGKQNCHLFKSVLFPEKRQRRPESGISKMALMKWNTNFRLEHSVRKTFCKLFETFCKTLNVWSNICIQNGSKQITNVAREAEA